VHSVWRHCCCCCCCRRCWANVSKRSRVGAHACAATADHHPGRRICHLRRQLSCQLRGKRGQPDHLHDPAGTLCAARKGGQCVQRPFCLHEEGSALLGAWEVTLRFPPEHVGCALQQGRGRPSPLPPGATPPTARVRKLALGTRTCTNVMRTGMSTNVSVRLQALILVC